MKDYYIKIFKKDGSTIKFYGDAFYLIDDILRCFTLDLSAKNNEINIKYKEISKLEICENEKQ